MGLHTSTAQRQLSVDAVRAEAERFRANVDQRGPEECWLWMGGMTGRGYGNFNVRPANSPTGRYLGVGAHRIAYMLAHGAIPDLMVLDHLCRTPRCVNPNHLEAVDHTTNLRRAPQPRGFRSIKPEPYHKQNGTTTWRVRFRHYADDGTVSYTSRAFKSREEAEQFIQDGMAPIAKAG